MNQHIDYIDNSHEFAGQEFTPQQVDELGKLLLATNTPISDKKKSLGILAHLGNLQAYEYLKKYSENPDSELEEWAKLAYGECTLFLHGDICGDDDCEFVFTGVGKNNNMLRVYFMVLPHEGKSFETWQHDIIRKEMSWVAADLQCEGIEWFDCQPHYVGLSLLQSVNVSKSQFIDTSIAACNEFGNFVMPENYAGSSVPTATEIVEIIDIVRYGEGQRPDDICRKW